MSIKATNLKQIEAYQKTVFFTARQAGLNDTQAKIIVAQATHESGRFSSNVFADDNNLFGMKMPSQRDKQYIKGASKRIMRNEGATPYASYANISDSVKDLLLSYHKARKTNWSLINTPADYANWLKKINYYGAPLEEYKNALTRFFSQVQGLKYTLPFGLIFFFNSNTFINTFK